MEAIFYTDGHLQKKKPICRLEETDEEWVNNQIDIRKQMFDYAEKHNIKTILNGGDIFETWKAEDLPYLLSKTKDLYKNKNEYLCIGNHTLKYHNLDLINESQLGVLINFDLIKVQDKLILEDTEIDFYHYGIPLEPRENNGKFKIVVLHENIFQKTVPPYISGYTCEELIKQLPDYDLYLCGHNHEKYIYKKDGKTIINGGSFGRISANQVDFKPAFWYIDTSKGIFEEHQVDVKPLVSREHLDIKENREVFIAKAKNFNAESFDFVKVVENKIKLDKIIDEVKNIIYECIK